MADSAVQPLIGIFKESPELKEKAERAAERQGRSLSSYMRRVLRLALKAEGELDQEDEPTKVPA